MAREVLGDDLTPAQLADFRYMRESAEKKARATVISEDVTISQIYSYFDTSWLGGISINELIEKEMLIEKSVLRPIQKTKSIIEKFHSEGFPICYISDMYLPSIFFKDLLEKYGFWKEGDKIFVSCEIGKSKSTGNLFQYIKRTENLSYKEWKHFGDNRHSDYIVPKRLGISCVCHEFKYSYYQEKTKLNNLCVYENYIGRVAGISRSICLGGTDDYFCKFAADIIAPLYVSFVFSILVDSQRRGITRLFFLARDGYILYQIAAHLQELFPSIELRYLFVSRKSLYLPSLDEITESSVSEILIDSNKASVPEYLDNLQLNKSDIQRYENEQSLSSLLSSIKRNWEEQSELVIEYFKQQGMASNESSVAIVDIRGKRNCQRCINKILRKNNYNDVFAYYLEANANRVFPVTADEYMAFFFSDFVRGQNFDNMSTSVFLLERYFCLSDQLRTAGYKKDNNDSVIPVFDVENIPRVYKQIESINKKACILFCDAYVINKLYKFNLEILNSSLAIFSSFAKKPRREYLSVLTVVRFSETKYMEKRIIGMLTPKRLKNNQIKWIRGSLMYMCPVFLFLYDFAVRKYKQLRAYYY